MNLSRWVAGSGRNRVAALASKQRANPSGRLRWAPASLSMTWLALLGLLVSAPDAGSRDLERGSAMQTKTTEMRPPMDANLPATLETATFALG